MQPLRQRAARAAWKSRQTCLQRQWRRHASDSHGHHHAHDAPVVEEPLGAAFYVAVAAVPATMLVYSISRPAKDGEPTSFSKFLGSFDSLSKTWEERNTTRTAIFEQAAHDKHLFNYAGRNKHVELTYPEVFQTGSPFNVPAGHFANLDKVVDHYKEQHLAEEARKAEALASKTNE